MRIGPGSSPGSAQHFLSVPFSTFYISLLSYTVSINPPTEAPNDLKMKRILLQYFKENNNISLISDLELNSLNIF